MGPFSSAARYLHKILMARPCVACRRAVFEAACDECLDSSSAALAFVEYGAADHCELRSVHRIGRYFRGPEV